MYVIILKRVECHTLSPGSPLQPGAPIRPILPWKDKGTNLKNLSFSSKSGINYIIIFSKSVFILGGILFPKLQTKRAPPNSAIRTFCPSVPLRPGMPATP